MRATLFIIALSIFATIGCVTMPDPVPDAYLSRKNAEQGKTLEMLEKKAIARNRDVRTLREREADAERILKVEEGRLSILKEEKLLLEGKGRQYQLENDSEQIAENARLMGEKDAQIQAQGFRAEFSSARRGLARAEREVAEAELAVSVAELNYEKSRIAGEYLVAADPEVKEGAKKGPFAPKPENYDQPYRKFLDKQRAVLEKKTAARDEAAVNVKIAEQKLQ